MSKLEKIMDALEYTNPAKLDAKRMAIAGFCMGAGVNIYQLVTNDLSSLGLEQKLIFITASTLFDTGLFALVGYVNQRVNCRYVYPFISRILKINEDYSK